MRGATSLSNRNAWANSAISIHAPRAGRDSSRRGRVCISLNFNPRAPCGARLLIVPQIRSPVYFNPRAPCGARPRSRVHIPPQSYFNPRAPCGARPDTWRSSTPRRKFQSMRPVRGATVSATVTADQINISIHAPRAGRDGLRPGGGPHRNDFNPRAPCGARQMKICYPVPFQNFNPRAPCGARLSACACVRRISKFQSTRPVRGATISTS